MGEGWHQGNQERESSKDGSQVPKTKKGRKRISEDRCVRQPKKKREGRGQREGYKRFLRCGGGRICRAIRAQLAWRVTQWCIRGYTLNEQNANNCGQLALGLTAVALSEC